MNQAHQIMEPWPEPVDGAELLSEIRACFRKEVFLEDDKLSVCAVWTALTHLEPTPKMDFGEKRQRDIKPILKWMAPAERKKFRRTVHPSACAWIDAQLSKLRAFRV
jgi:hypothetical protein